MTDGAQTAASINSNALPAPTQGWLPTFLRTIRRSPMAAAGLFWVIVLSVCVVAAGWIAPYDPLRQNLENVLSLPSAANWLGTDSLGRDILSRLLWGGQDALLGAVEVVLVATVIGVPIGVIAGFVGGWFDAVANRTADLLFSLPAVIVMLALAAVFGTSTSITMAGLGVLISAVYLRLARASTLAVRRELYVDAARVAGIPTVRVIFGHILPNVVGPLIVQSSLTLGSALLLQAGLGFLGLGPVPPAPSWGAMVNEASQYLNQQPWLMVPSGFILIFTILAVNLIGDALRDGDGERQRASMLDSVRNTPSGSRNATADTIKTDYVLDVNDLVISFPNATGATDVVRGASFRVGRGETVGLVGESGSGKTMSALAVLGLIPHPGAVTRGSIRFHGRELVTAREVDFAVLRGRGIGFISQEPMLALDPSFTVGSQLIAPLRRHRGIGRAEAKTQSIGLLTEVGIRNPEMVMKNFAHQLSGGMAQRVAIAIALTGNPELLIADEPTTALDVTVQADILDLLRSLQTKHGMSILLVTHDLGVVADMCSRAVVMQQGLIVEDAQIDDLFEAPRHEYTRKLISATPSLLEERNA